VGGEGGKGGDAVGKGGEGGSGGGVGGDAGGGRGGKTTNVSATLSMLALTPSCVASVEVMAVAPSAPLVALAASAGEPSRTTVIVTLVEVAIGVVTLTDEPSAAPRELVSALVSSEAAVAFALRLSAAPSGTSMTNVTCAVCNCRPLSSLVSCRRIELMLTVQPAGWPAQTPASTVAR